MEILRSVRIDIELDTNKKTVYEVFNLGEYDEEETIDGLLDRIKEALKDSLYED